MKVSFEANSQVIPLELVPSGTSYRLTLNDKTIDVEIIRAEEGKLDLLIDGKRLTAHVSSDNAKRWVTIGGQTIVLTKTSGARKGGLLK